MYDETIRENDYFDEKQNKQSSIILRKWVTPTHLIIKTPQVVIFGCLYLGCSLSKNEKKNWLEVKNLIRKICGGGDNPS